VAGATAERRLRLPRRWLAALWPGQQGGAVALATARRRAAPCTGATEQDSSEKCICDSVSLISELETLPTPILNLRGVQVQIFKEHMSK
jgi:hypothetical protein